MAAAVVPHNEAQLVCIAIRHLEAHARLDVCRWRGALGHGDAVDTEHARLPGAMFAAIRGSDGDLCVELALGVGCPTERSAGDKKANGDVGRWGFAQPSVTGGDGDAAERDRGAQ